MTLGALVAILVIVLAATQLPHLFKAKAGGAENAGQQAASTATSSAASTPQTANANATPQPSPSVSEPVPPTNATVSQGGPSGSQTSQPSEQLQGSDNPVTQPSAAGGTQKTLARGPRGEGTAPATHHALANQAGGQAEQPPEQAVAPASEVGKAAQAPASEASDAKELEELGDHITALAGRANAMKDSVENLRQQQKSAGFSLRPDISASLNRMEQYMDKANAALNAHAPEAAKKNMDLAEREVEKLEQFFGR
jgi:hypothetical protein